MKQGVKRFAAFVLAGLVLFGLSACGGEDVQKTLAAGEQALYADRPAAMSYWEPVTQKEGYESLNDRQKLCYLTIYQAVEQMSQDEVTAGEGLTETEVQEVLDAYYDDNPQQFWISDIRSSATLESIPRNPVFQAMDELLSAWTGKEYSKEPLYQLHFQPSYLWSADEQESMEARMKETMEQAYAQLSPGMSEFEREEALHDWLMRQCCYSHLAASQILKGGDQLDYYLTSASAYGAIVQHTAVCTGYARAMKLLLNGAGIECRLQSGEAPSPEWGQEGEMAGHVWNVVTIDGQEYHLDPTWNDTGDWLFQIDMPAVLSDRYENYEAEDAVYRGYVHLYFNVTDEEIGQTHTMEEAPGCAASDGQYYRRKGLWFTKIGDQERAVLTEEIVRAVGRETCMVEMDLGGAENPDALTDRLINEEDGVLFSCIEGANNQLKDVRLREDYVVYQQEESGKLILYFIKE